ncbi:MAG: LamG-like jellyroll fold domain-containing protein, partial [Verrucomicrobiota bacterium]
MKPKTSHCQVPSGVLRNSILRWKRVRLLGWFARQILLASAVTRLAADVPPTITAQPQSQTATAGANVTFAVTADGTAPLGYQWRKSGATLTDGGNVSGAATAALTLANVRLGDAGNYDVVVSNGLGTNISRAATLTVTIFPRPIPSRPTSFPLGVPSIPTIQGAVIAWGWNYFGQTTVPSGLTNVVAIAGGFSHSLALQADGAVVEWGRETVPSGLTNVVAIAAGSSHDLALQADGTVVAWGSDFWGQTDVPPDLTNVVAIAGGGQHSLALQADGAVVAWGDNEFGQTDVPPGLTNVVAIAGGFRHSLALQADGTVVAWGANESGETTIPSSLTNVVAIAGGGQHNLALQAGGTVVAWGDDAWGERDVPSDLTNVVAIAEGECYSLALKADGTMVAWGRGSYGEATVPLGLTNVVAIAGGFHHSLALVGGVLVPISITSPPQDQTVMAGTSVTLSVVASGTRPISYQWRLEGADISGATGPDYPIASVQPSDAGAYTVVVGNVLNSVTSAPPALLTVLAPPTITAQPQSQTAVAGTNVSFTVTADGTVPLSYQWQFNAVNLVNGGRISGADTASLSLVNVHSADTGNYTVVVTNAYGSATSQVAVLTVTGSNSSVHYVDGGSANPVSPYANWATAARTIQDAVVVAVDGDTVLVTNGVYLLDNQIAITNGITVTSVNGPQVTVVDGGYPARTNRCFVLSHARAVLEGFTIRGGYAHLGGGVRMTASDLANDRFWVWATPAYDEVNPPVLDADGNLYVAGGAYGDSNRVFVEKYAPGGARLWTTELRSDAGPSCLHLDGLGHLYVGGCVGPSGSLGNLRDAYLVKLDLQGNVLWEHTWGSDSHDFVYGLQTDTAGNVYASGYTWGDIDGAPEPGNDDLFLSQFTPEGDRPWTRLYGTWTDEALGLLLPDGQNGFYLVGYGREPGPYDFRFARLTADGTEVWTHLVGIPGRNEWVEFAGTDSGGSVYAGGRTDGATNAVTGALESGLYLAKLGLDGSTAWTQCWDLPDVAVTGLTGAVDPTGNVYVAAPGEMTADGIIHPRSDIYLWKISSAGDWQWCKPFGIGTNAYLAGLTLDGAGGLFLDWYSYGGFEGHVNAGLYDSYLGHWTFDNPFGGLVSRCIVEDNQAEQGGGVALGQLGGLRNCLIAANTASGLGGGVYSQGGTVESSTLSGNSAQSGAGLYADGPVQVVNSILYGNTAGAWADCASSDASAMVSYSLVGTGIVPGTGNITGDPQFANPAGSDYRLAPGSPCVDTGTNLAWMTGAMDLKGGLRVQGLAVDMGAYEQSGNCVPPPVGLVAWWPAEGNANDIIGGNNGTLTNGATFASGMVGQAFLLNGNNHVEVADSPGLRPAAFTVEAWVQPFSFRPAYFDTVVSKGQSNFDPRLPFGDDSLWLGFADGKPTFYSHHATSGLQHLEAPQVAPLNQWLHLAATFDGSVRNLFVNGAVVGSGAAVGEIVYDSAPVPWLIGQDWVAGHPSNEGFNGLIDEVRLYSLALTAEEIRGIYQAGSAGVCRSNSPPAVAITEPADGAVVTAGNDLVITATASDTDGTVTQVEFFAGTNSLGAVSASPFTRVWTNVPAGSYVLTAVATDNQGATNTSAPVNFTVTTPICLPRPPGLVAWWPGDGNANDIIGGNNGTLTNGATFAAGKVGQAFSFNTNHAGVLVGNPASLQLQDFTIEAWIRRGSTAFTTDDPTAVQAAANLFCYGSQGYTLGVFPNGTLYLSKVDVDAVSAGPGVTDTNFHHVAVTKSGTSVTFYIDRSGYPVAAPYTDTFQFTTPAAIGGRGDTLNGNNNSSFCGTIDELSIYNRALSSNEIAAIYSAGSAGKCFTFVNQAPSFVKGLDVAVNENAGPQTIANWATAVSPGPPNETGQKLTFTVTNNNNGLFAVQPVLGTNGTLTFTPATNASGMATVTVVLKDDGGTANGGQDTSAPQAFTITMVAASTSTIHYVDGGSANPVSPYGNWATAARTIQDAVAVAVDGDTVLVTNGVYSPDHQIAITNGITVTSVNGPQVTVVDGGYPARTGRCFVLSHSQAVLEGFTVRGGYAHLGGGVRVTSSDLANDRTLVWASPAYDEVNPPALDADGNLYVAGGAYSSASNRVFVEKYAPGGARLWATELRSDAEPACLQLDGLGHLYVGGSVGPSPAPGGNQQYDAYLVKLDLQGNVLWERTWGSDLHDYVYGVQTDETGNVYASGYTGRDIDGAAKPGLDDLFVSKFTPEGDRPWTRLYGTWSDETDGLLLRDGQGGFYLLGNGREPGAQSGLPYDFRFARLTADGTEVWTQLVGIPGRNEWVSFAGTDSGGSVYAGGVTDGATNAVTGGLEAGAFVAKLHPDGSIAWTRCWDMPGAAVTRLVGAVDPTGNVYLAAPSEMTADGITHPRSDIYLWKISSAGEWQWCKPFGIGTKEYLAGLTLDGAGGLFLDWWSFGGFEGRVNAGLYDSYLGHWTFGNPFGGLVSRCMVEDNQAEQGGGVALGQLGGLRNCLVVSNSVSGLGGGVYAEGGTVESTTLSGNSALSGAGLYADGPAQVVNSILYGNTAGAWADCAPSNATALVSYSLVGTGLVPGPGNLTGDPRFVNPAGGDYRLAPGSPCVDTGTNLAWMTGATDLEGELRVLGLAVDMGAYELIAEADCIAEGYRNGFSNVAGLTFSGDAERISTADGFVLRLTPATTFQSGSVFSASPVNAARFSTFFSFRISNRGGMTTDYNPTPGADGLVFVLQAISGASLGVYGGGLGYQGITNSVGVEFDTWNNYDGTDYFDPDSNHVGIDLNGDVSHGVGAPYTASVEPDFDDGNIWYAWVDYDGTMLEVRVAQINARPVNPTLRRILDVPGVLRAQNAFVGFTSGTGAGWGNHDILTWQYNKCFSPITNHPPFVQISSPTSGAVFVTGTNITITATASDSDGTVTAVEFFQGGSNSLGVVTKAPYSLVWNNVPVGLCALTAVAVDDGGLRSTSAPVNISVIYVNHSPSFTKGADLTVNENAGPQTNVAWGTGISAGPPNESNQTLAFTLTADTPGLFAV